MRMRMARKKNKCNKHFFYRMKLWGHLPLRETFTFWAQTRPRTKVLMVTGFNHKLAGLI